MPPLKKFKDIKSASIILQAFNIYEGYLWKSNHVNTETLYKCTRDKSGILSVQRGAAHRLGEGLSVYIVYINLWLG